MTTSRVRVWGRLAWWVPLALLVGGCSTADKGPKPVAPPVTVAAPGKPAVTVSDSNDGQRVVVESGQEFLVQLATSSWAVQNNMEWSVAELAPGVLTVVGSRFARTGLDINPLESEGTTVFRLRPQAPGRVTLTFAQRRPYSVGAPVRSVSFDVTVK